MTRKPGAADVSPPREKRHTWWRVLTHISRSLRLQVVVMTVVLSTLVTVRGVGYRAGVS